jgi:hypothetical protein
MPRTSINLDASVLSELKRRQKQEGKALGTLASELLAQALARDASTPDDEPFTWTARAMGSKVDLADKEAVQAAMEQRR